MTYDAATEALDAQIKNAGATFERMTGEIGRRIVGQQAVIGRLIMALVAEGHVLLEGLPGLAKTSMVKALAETAALSFRRIQFTPDLLPADVVGTQTFDPQTGSFRVRQGPVFANLVLADEINRAPAKVQSALLEAMQERQVTIGDQTFKLARPFLVLATQNPIEQEGTYPLPEAQTDRFLFKVKLTYGTVEDEIEVVSRAAASPLEQDVPLTPLVDGPQILHLRDLATKLHVAEKIRRYIVQLVFATRDPAKAGIKDLIGMIHVGASPRASINLERAARVNALMNGRAFVTPQDVKDVGLDVLRHRLIPTYEAEAEGVSTDDLVRRLFDRVDVP